MRNKFLWLCLYITPVVLSGYYFGGKYLKKAAIEVLNQQLQVRVDVHSVEFSGLSSFPHFGLRFHNVRVTESMPAYNQLLLNAGEVVVEINPIKLFRGQNEVDKIELVNGTARIYMGEDGQTNFQIFKSDASANKSSDIEIDLKKVRLKNFRCLYKDDGNAQSLNFHTNHLAFKGKFGHERYAMSAKGDALFDHLVFDGNNYISGRSCDFDLDLEIDQNLKSCHVEKALFAMDKLQLDVQGDILMIGENPDFDIKFEGKNMDIQSLLSLLPNEQRYAYRDLQSNGIVSLTGFLKGSFEEQTMPEFKIRFGMEDVAIFNPNIGLDIRHILLNGAVENGIDEKPIKLAIDLKALRMTNTNVAGKFVVDDLSKPMVEYSCNGQVDVRDFQGLIKSANPGIAKIYGNVQFNIAGKMPIDNQTSTVNYQETSIDGDLVLLDFTLNGPDLIPVDHLYLNSRIHSEVLKINELKGSIAESQWYFKGEARNWRSYLRHKNRLSLLGELACQDLNLNKLLKTQNQTPADENYLIDLDLGVDLDLKMSAAKFAWDKLDAQDLFGHLIWINGDLRLQDVRLNAWQGKVRGNAFISQSTTIFELTSKLTATDVSIEKLFKEFENFGQTEFTSDILNGQLTTTVDMRIIFDRSFNVIEDSIQLLADISILNGALKNYQPMQSLSSFVQMSDLMNIQFDRLQNTIELKNRMIYIPTMTIKNNAMNVELGGSHSFDNYMDYKIKIRVTELLAGKSGWAQRKKEQQLQEEKEGGLSAFIKMSGTPDNLKIRYDVKSVKEVVGQEIKAERKSFFKDVKKEFKGESIESTEPKKKRWIE